MTTKKLKFFIVEDSAVDMRFLEKILTKSGHIVIGTFVTGEDAIAKAADLRPDMIFMDIELGGQISGIDASSELKSKYSIPVIYITSYTDSKILEQVNELSPYGYIVKPFHKKNLHITIEIAINRFNFDMKLEESEKKYRRIFEESEDAIFIKGCDGNFIDFNRSMETIFGYSRDELLKKSLYGLAMEPEDVDAFESALEQSEYVKDFEINFIGKDGKVITRYITANSIKNSEGASTGCQAIIRDISEKKLLDEKIKMSEEKYRILIEGSNDIIFTLDENMNFLNVNKSLYRHLNYKPEEILSKSFFDILFENEDANAVSVRFIRSKLASFKKMKLPINFSAQFKSSISTEPKELQVKLEYVNIEGKNEILGKASKVIEDTLLKYFISEKLTYKMENYLFSAEDVSHRITRNLEKYMDQKDINILRIAVREIIINAIEHGNLDITFQEKTDALENENYIELLTARQHDEEIMNKKVTIEYLLKPDRVIYKISDEGKGFDFKKIIHELDKVNENYIAHGRGIKMAANIFDKIVFNRKGNQVLLQKNFKKI